MKLSRRVFLASGALAAVPSLPLQAANVAVPRLAVGELWGMPYLAPGALGNPPAGCN